jgi:uncharacterized protein involved in exopolysaccharide biosynthesis
LVAATVFLLVVCGTVAYYLQSPPLYRAEAKVLAQSSRGMPTAVRSTFDELPTKTALEIIHQRENLIAIIRETKLLESREGQRPPAWKRLLSWGKADDARAFPASLPAVVSDVGDERLDTLVTILDKRLLVVVDDDGTIALELDWPDPVQAHAIVQAALQNFLEARHVQEVTAMDDVITVLEGQAATLRQQLEKTLDQAKRRSTQPPPPSSEPRIRRPSEELVRLESSLQAKQRAVQDVEDFRRKRLSDLQAQLEQARTMLSDAHPTVIGLRKDIAGLSRESSQVQTLRDEERALRKAYSDRLAKEDYPAPLPRAAAPVIVPAKPDEDPSVRDARTQYEQAAARVNAAQVEREAARAAFKYRYNVVWPTQVAREPVSPNPKKIFAVGLFAAVSLALLAVVGPDLLSRRIFERWQVERSLGLPVLGDVRRDV